MIIDILSVSLTEMSKFMMIPIINLNKKI